MTGAAYRYTKLSGQSVPLQKMQDLGAEGWRVVAMTYDTVTYAYTVLMEMEKP